MMIIVNATLEAKDGKIDEIVEKAGVILNASRKHEGNISYNLFKNVEEYSLLFVEKWESKEALEKHMRTEEFLEFGQEIKDLLKSELKIQLFSAELVSE